MRALVSLPPTSLRCIMVRGVAGIILGRCGLARGLCLPARACDLSPPETGTVAAVIDGETLKLTDGRTVRLIGAKAPMPPLGWRGEDPLALWSMRPRRRCRRLPPAGRSSSNWAGSRLDRHGYLLAQVFVVDRRDPALAPGGADRQGPRPRLFLPRQPRLRRRASGARERRRGPSGSACGAPRSIASSSALDVKRLGRLIHSYQLVEGTVAAVGEGGGRLYLNFARTGGATSPSASSART